MTSTTHRTGYGAPTPEQLCERFTGCVERADLDGLVALYAKDAVVSLPEGREAAGHAAIRAAFAAAFEAGLELGCGTGGDLPDGELGVGPAKVVLAGTLAMTSTTDADGVVRTQVARREPDGTWLWVRDGSRLRDVHPAVFAAARSTASTRAS
jgi:ketosteroid isomerase-like protein